MCTCEIQNLLSGSVDIVVAKGIVALLILAVVLTGAHLVSIGTGKYWLAGYTRYLYEFTANGCSGVVRIRSGTPCCYGTTNSNTDWV